MNGGIDWNYSLTRLKPCYVHLVAREWLQRTNMRESLLDRGDSFMAKQSHRSTSEMAAPKNADYLKASDLGESKHASMCQIVRLW